MKQARNERREIRENQLVKRVEDAIAQIALRGETPSLYKVSRIVGMDRTSLRVRPRIKELILSCRESST